MGTILESIMTGTADEDKDEGRSFGGLRLKAKQRCAIRRRRRRCRRQRRRQKAKTRTKTLTQGECDKDADGDEGSDEGEVGDEGGDKVQSLAKSRRMKEHHAKRGDVEENEGRRRKLKQRSMETRLETNSDTQKTQTR